MGKFVIHFFKERVRTLDHEKLFSFFREYPEIKQLDANIDDTEVYLVYRHPIINTDIKFILSRSSAVKEITQIRPQFLDVNFRLEMSILTPYYLSLKIFEIVRKFVEEFDLLIFNSLLEDAGVYTVEKGYRLFELAKKDFKDKFGYLLKNFLYYPEDKLSDILKYIDEQYELQQYYKNDNVYVPNYYIISDEDNRVYFAMEWEEGNSTVFPPHLDYIYYISGLESKILPYNEVMAKIEKFTTNVPGFIQNTKVTDPKQIKKISKTLRKTKFTPVDISLSRVDLNKVIDL